MTRRQRTDGLSRAADTAGKLLIIGVAIFALLWLMGRLRLIVIPIILAVFVAALLVPPTQWLRRHGWPRAAATTVTTLGALAVVAGVVALLAPTTADGIDRLGNDISRGIDEVRQWLADRFGLDDQALSNLVDRVREQIRSHSGELAGGALAGAIAVGEVVTGFVLTVVLAIYFVYDGDRLVNSLLALLPVRHRRSTRAAAELAWDVVGRYIRGVAIVGLTDGILMAIALAILGVPLVVPLALLVFIGAFLPFVGAFLSGMLAALVALVAKGPVIALLVVAAAVLVQQLEGHVVAPQVYGRSLELHPVLIIVAIAAGATVVGISGAFFAVPVVAVLVSLRRGAVAEPPA